MFQTQTLLHLIHSADLRALERARPSVFVSVGWRALSVPALAQTEYGACGLLKVRVKGGENENETKTTKTCSFTTTTTSTDHDLVVHENNDHNNHLSSAPPTAPAQQPHDTNSGARIKQEEEEDPPPPVIPFRPSARRAESEETTSLWFGLLVKRRVSKGKIPPPHIENAVCDALFEYTNRLVLLEGQEPQLWPRLQAFCHAVSHFQLSPVMLKMQGLFPTPTSTTVRIFSLLA